MFKTITDLMRERFGVLSGKTGIVVVGDSGVQLRMSYAELDAVIGRAANRFRELEVAKGDRVILYLPKSIDLVIGHLAALLIGAIAVPLNPAFTRDEMEYYIGSSEGRRPVDAKSGARCAEDHRRLGDLDR